MASVQVVDHEIEQVSKSASEELESNEEPTFLVVVGTWPTQVEHELSRACDAGIQRDIEVRKPVVCRSGLRIPESRLPDRLALAVGQAPKAC